MDWQTMFSNAGRQSVVFWVGVAAVATGLTMLLTAGLLQVRRRWRRFQGRRAALPRQVAAAYAAASAPAETPAPTAPPMSFEPIPPSLAILLRRLQIAGDRLEEVSRALIDESDPTPESLLKADVPEVEYVFKACGP